MGTIPVSDAVDIRRQGLNLVVLTGTGLTYKSADYGASWTAVGTASQVGMSGLTTLAGDLVAVSKEGLVARSGDGAAWSWVGAINQLNVIALANDDPTTDRGPRTTDFPRRPRCWLLPGPILCFWPGPPLEVEFELQGAGRVELALFDLSGRRVLEQGNRGFLGSWNPYDSMVTWMN